MAKKYKNYKRKVNSVESSIETKPISDDTVKWLSEFWNRTMTKERTHVQSMLYLLLYSNMKVTGIRAGWTCMRFVMCMIAAYAVYLLLNNHYGFVADHVAEIISAAVAVATFLGFVLWRVVTMSFDVLANALYREYELTNDSEKADNNEQ
jgi:hypothetical protein